MASETGTLFVWICTVAVTCTADFVSVETQSSTGLTGQSSKLGCMVKATQEAKIREVYWKKNDDILMRVKNGDVQTLDKRLQFADTNWMTSNIVSLLVKDTKISDEGAYSCTVVTDRGIGKGDATLVVQAHYSQPVMTFNPMKELTCVTSGGYPKGAIHWFDGLKTNWTRSAKTEDIQMEDKSFKLQSTFISTSDSPDPYRCVVFNSKWEEEVSAEINITGTLSPNTRTGEQTKNIAAGVVVIGSLICGLLIALLLFRRRFRHPGPDNQDGDDIGTELNKPQPYEEA